MANYNKDTDYTKLIEQAVKSGNLAGAALLEQQRNNKIGDMGLNYEQTNNYGQYLPNNGTNPNGGSADAIYTYNAGQGDAKGRMNTNSAQWWAAKGMGDTEMMKSLEEANRQLSTLLGGGVQFNGTTGTWGGVADMPATMQASMNTGVVAERPTYQSAYNAQIDALMNGLLNREKFSYDAESDPMFQQYRDIYTREGNRSMNDTLAAAASGAGGMSSYAMTAAQQANNYYMAQLGDKIPELQQLAYEMYLDDMNLQRQDISMLMDAENRDYSRYRDQMGDYQWATGFNYDAYRDQVADDRYKTEWEHALEREAYEDAWRDKEWNYGVSRDAYEDAWRQKEWDYNTSLGDLGFTGGEDDDDTGYTGGSGDDTGYTGGTGGNVVPNNGGYDNGGLSEEQIKAAQKYYGVTADGKWGPKSQAAANGMSAYDAWMAMSDNTFWGGVNDLGLGPRAASVIAEISEYGGVIENPDGSVSWADGWNASNYRQKIEEAKKKDPFNGAYDLFEGFQNYLANQKK